MRFKRHGTLAGSLTKLDDGQIKVHSLIPGVKRIIEQKLD